MSVALAAEPRLLHAIPGRMRVHIPGWSGHDQRSLETRLRKVEGIKGVLANPVTGNQSSATHVPVVAEDGGHGKRKGGGV